MKRNINKITFICAVAIMSSSCHFLEVEKIGKSDIESFFESEESVEAAVTGCMDILNGLVDDYMILYPEICGDLVVMNASESGCLMETLSISAPRRPSCATSRVEFE